MLAISFCGIHYLDVIMGAMASQITSLTIVYSTIHSAAAQRKHQSSASLVFVRGINRWPVNSPHKWPVTRKMFPFYDVIMFESYSLKFSRIVSLTEGQSCDCVSSRKVCESQHFANHNKHNQAQTVYGHNDLGVLYIHEHKLTLLSTSFEPHNKYHPNQQPHNGIWWLGSMFVWWFPPRRDLMYRRD